MSSFVHTLKVSRWLEDLKAMFFAEVPKQVRLVLPMSVMNLASLAKITISTAFLGRMGSLHLAGGTLALTFANVTGFSVLSGLASAMEPICGQAYGAKNFDLIHRTLFMALLMLLVACIPISILWINVEKILICFGQDVEIANIARTYLLYLLPDLVATSFLCPIKSYFGAQCITLSMMVCFLVPMFLHIPINIFLTRGGGGGIAAIALSICWTDLNTVSMLAVYAFFMERREKAIVENNETKPWWHLLWSGRDWVQLLRLSGPSCLLTCLEWWCYEIMVLLTGRLVNAQQAVSVLAVVLNADYLLYSVMISLATCASVRVANELGANQPQAAYEAVVVAITSSVGLGGVGAVVLVCLRSAWGRVFSMDIGVIEGVSHVMLFMAALEVVNFPMTVAGGILRGTARPSFGLYANIGGFYLVALPIGAVLAFKVGMGLDGLFSGFLVGVGLCAVVLVGLVHRIDWVWEAKRAQDLASIKDKEENEMINQ